MPNTHAPNSWWLLGPGLQTFMQHDLSSFTAVNISEHQYKLCLLRKPARVCENTQGQVQATLWLAATTFTCVNWRTSIVQSFDGDAWVTLENGHRGRTKHLVTRFCNAKKHSLLRKKVDDVDSKPIGCIKAHAVTQPFNLKKAPQSRFSSKVLLRDFTTAPEHPQGCDKGRESHGPRF